MKSLFFYVLSKKHGMNYLFCCCFLLYETVLQIAFACFSHELEVTFTLNKQNLSVLSASYFISYSLCQILAANWLNRYSLRAVFLSSVFGLALCTYFFSTSTCFSQACLARFFMGFSSASAFILVVNATKIAFKKQYLTLFLGISQLFSASLVVFFQAKIASLSQIYSFRTLLLWLSFVGLTLFLLAWLFMKRQVKAQTDLEEYDFIKTLKHVLTYPRIWQICLYSFFLWGPVVGISALWGPYFLAQKMIGSHEQAIFVSSLIFFGLAVASPIIGAFCIHEKWRQKVVILCPCIAFLSAIGFWLIPKCSVFIAGIFMVTMGACCAAYEVSYALIRQVFYDHRANIATALNNMASIASIGVFQVTVGFFMTVSHNQIKVALFVPILFYATAIVLGQKILVCTAQRPIVSGKTSVKNSFCI